MAIPLSYVDNYSAALNRATDTARLGLFDALNKLDYSADIADIRNAAIAAVNTACDASTLVSARLAADFYNGLREIELGELMAVGADTARNREATEQAIRAFIQVLVDDADVARFIELCIGRLDYETRRAANETVAYNARQDSEKPRWARIPTGDETCAYCLLMASLGFHFGDEKTASHTHENCDCRVVPSWGDEPVITGYESKLAEYEQLYKDADNLRKAVDKPDELRLRIASARNKHAADVAAGRTRTKWTTINELAICARWLNPALH